MKKVRLLKSLLRRLIDTFLPFSSAYTYSQCGEDILIRTRFATYSRFGMLFNRPRVAPGFYVDIGAYSPKRLSNTYWLYTAGWRGITVEPDSSAAWTFKLARPRDTHLPIAISGSSGEVQMAIGDYSAVNMVCGPTLAAKESNATFCRVPCRTLKSILDEYLPNGQKIDLLSIDCEGVELEILESNDWSRYVPSVICVEDFEWCESGSSSSQISNFLLARGYQAFGWAGASVLWEHESFRKRVIT